MISKILLDHDNGNKSWAIIAIGEHTIIRLLGVKTECLCLQQLMERNRRAILGPSTNDHIPQFSHWAEGRIGENQKWHRAAYSAGLSAPVYLHHRQRRSCLACYVLQAWVARPRARASSAGPKWPPIGSGTSPCAWLDHAHAGGPLLVHWAPWHSASYPRVRGPSGLCCPHHQNLQRLVASSKRKQHYLPAFGFFRLSCRRGHCVEMLVLHYAKHQHHPAAASLAHNYL